MPLTLAYAIFTVFFCCLAKLLLELIKSFKSCLISVVMKLKYFFSNFQTICSCTRHLSKVVFIYKLTICICQLTGAGKGVHMYKSVGVRIADFISFFLNIP